MYIGSAIGIGFFLNNEYRISENGKILISVHLYKVSSTSSSTKIFTKFVGGAKLA